MRILYNIQDIQYAVDKISENGQTFLPEDRLIKIAYETLEKKPIIDGEDQSRLTCWYSNQLSSLSCENTSYILDGTTVKTGCFNPLTRINRYLLCIRRSMTTAQNILSSKIREANLSLDLSSSLTDVNSTNTIFSLTDFNEHTKQTFDLLSSFFDKASTDVLTQHPTIQGKRLDLLNRTVVNIDDFTSVLLNDQNCRGSEYDDITDSADKESQLIVSDYLLKYEFKSSDNQKNIIDCSDILYLLNMFIQNLQNTKYVSILWNHKISRTTTKLNAYANLLIKEFQSLDSWADIQTQYANFSKAGTNVSLTISPWVKQTTSGSNRLMLYTFSGEDSSTLPQNYQYLKDFIYDPDTRTTTIREYRGIILNNIIYDNSSGSSLLQNIPTDIAGTNGIFGHELNVDKQDVFKLTLQDIQKQFGIFPDTVISRKNILNAIDYIFRYWLEHMSTVSYTITSCHSNCHENTVESRYATTIQRYVTGSVYYCGYLRYTLQCGCNNISSFSVNMFNLIPEKYRTADAVVGQKIYACLTKGGYYTNKSALLELNVGSDHETLLAKFKTADATSYIQTTQNFTTGSITVNAVRDTGLKTDEQCFCLKIELKARYNYVPPAE